MMTHKGVPICSDAVKLRKAKNFTKYLVEVRIPMLLSPIIGTLSITLEKRLPGFPPSDWPSTRLLCFVYVLEVSKNIKTRFSLDCHNQLHIFIHLFSLLVLVYLFMYVCLACHHRHWFGDG